MEEQQYGAEEAGIGVVGHVFIPVLSHWQHIN